MKKSKGSGQMKRNGKNCKCDTPKKKKKPPVKFNGKTRYA